MGDRSGFFGWGLTSAYRWRDGPWSAEAGLFVGSGGGSPIWVGGGLMLRPHLMVSRDIGPLRLGLGVSRLRLPTGMEDETQPSLSLAWTGDWPAQAWPT